MPRRVQFSSCDNCRRARVACDAGRNDLDSAEGCTRCYNRGKDCTFEVETSYCCFFSPSLTVVKWRAQQVKGPKGKRARTGSPCEEREQPPAPVKQRLGQVNPAASTLNARDAPSQNSPSEDVVPSEEQRVLLHNIYLSTFETVFGNWMSRYGCPFVSVPSLLNTLRPADLRSFGDESVPESSVSISSLCSQLDSWMQTEADLPSPRTYTGYTNLASDKEIDSQIRQSLDRCIYSYSARWLHLFPCPSAMGIDPQAIARKLWRESRVDMLRVINRPSKRIPSDMVIMFICLCNIGDRVRLRPTIH